MSGAPVPPHHAVIDSLFQIQTRLQNLGSNLQNKCNDIEVLAVSPWSFKARSCWCVNHRPPPSVAILLRAGTAHVSWRSEKPRYSQYVYLDSSKELAQRAPFPRINPGERS